MSAQGIPRIFYVTRLYRRVLRLQRQLPEALRELGDQYAKDEFRRNKDANQIQAFEFMKEWTMYCETMERQLKVGAHRLGQDLEEDDIDSLTQEQLGQLYELQQEAKKPEKNDGSES